MVDINLLPTDISPKSPTKRLAETVKRIAIYASILLIVLLAGVGGYILYLSSQISNSVERQGELQASIESLEQTEQRLVILKDRLQKAGSVLSENTATPALDSFEQLSLNLPPAARLTEATIDREKSEVSYLVGSSSEITQLMAGVFSIDAYDEIRLTSFGFSPTSGYLVGLEME